MIQPQGTKITSDHETIKKWADERGGKPAIITTEIPDEVPPIKIKLPEDKVNGSKQVDWEKFFELLDTESLSFLYQDKTADGDKSCFYTFVFKR